MKKLKFLSVIMVLIFGLISCENEQISPEDSLFNDQETLKCKSFTMIKGKKATGFVQVTWKGQEKGSEKGNKPDSLLMFMAFNAHEESIYLDNWQSEHRGGGNVNYYARKHGGNNYKDAKGKITLSVLNVDYTPHREIEADVLDVFVDESKNQAWIVGIVVSDTKGCAGNSEGGHETGCSSGSHDDTGGGETDETTHDGGCSHDDTGTTGDTGTDGGCSDSDGETHDDSGGCSGGGSDMGGSDMGGSDMGGTEHTDGETHEEGGGSDMGGSDMGGTDHGSGSESKGNPLSGKNCRIGQVIAIKGHDGGTPGVNGDGITWKWFAADGEFVPSMDNMALWPHLCKKTILAGNIVIHK